MGFSSKEHPRDPSKLWVFWACLWSAQKERRRMVNPNDDDLGAAFSELVGLVKHVMRTVVAFRGRLKKIDSTLKSIDPIINEIEKYNNLLDRSPEEMAPIKDLLEEGKALVNKCLKIHILNVFTKYKHSKKLTGFNAAVVEKFQIYMALPNVATSKETSVREKDIRGEMKDIGGGVKDTGGDVRYVILLDFLPSSGVRYVIRLWDSPLSNGGSLPGGPDALDNLAVPAAPDFLVGSEMKASLSKVKERSLKEGASVIVVTAPGGCGKTTLLKKLCHDEAIEGKFQDNIMFVTVSKKTNLTDIVQEMYRHNRFMVPDIKSEDGAVRYLRLLLNKIGQDPLLLVLDDVWKKSESMVDKFICNEIKDYKIVVTSRYKFPCFRPVHHLNPLNHDEAVELFRQCVTVDDGSLGAPDAKLLNEIVEHCKRLPLVIEVVARSLRGQDYAFWRRKLDELADGQSLLDSDAEIKACLRKSLDDMDGDPSIKGRFMDLGSFPEDCNIPATALIDMWVELYKLDMDGVHAITDLHELVSRNLADLMVTGRDLSDDHESYSSHYYNGYYARQHDLLRELAIMECNEGEIEKRERLILELNGNKFPAWWSKQTQQPLGACLLSISTDKTFSMPWPNLELPKAEALVLNFQNDMQSKTYALPEFIEKADKLKALIVTNHGFFPAELRNLHVLGSNLRRIRFQRVAVPLQSMGNLRLHSLKKISFFTCKVSQASTSNDAKISEAMPNLVELDMDCCDDLVTLPDGICEIKSLRKLSITNCHSFSALPEEIGQLASLEVVRLSSCPTLWRLPGSIRSLQNVRLLDISSCLNLKTLPEQIGQMVDLERINMRGCSTLSRLPGSIVKLRNLSKVICEKGKAHMWGPLKDTLISLEITTFEDKASLDWLFDPQQKKEITVLAA